MSLLGRVENESGNMFVNFNQNITSLSVASKRGYSLYSLGNADTHLDKLYDSRTDAKDEEHKNFEDLFLIERLFESSLVAIVSLNAPRKLKMCHFKKGNEICNYSYSNTILSVKLNRLRLVVCLEESLYIHNIHDMKVVHTIRDTPSNPQGIFALSPCDKHNYLAYPGNISTGEVQIFDATHFHAKTMIPAHDSPLAAIAFSFNGTELATASEKGTVIRVFSPLDGTKLFEFRRGVKRCVSIASLSFSICSQFLACTSNTETVHIFKLDRSSVETENKPAPDDWMGYISKTVSSYLPTQVADVLTQGRAYASVALPEAGIKRICAITTIQKALRLLVASQDGFLYVYSVPLVEGNECQLIKKHDLRTLSTDLKDSQQAIEEQQLLQQQQSQQQQAQQQKQSSPPSGPSYASAVKGEDN